MVRLTFPKQKVESTLAMEAEDHAVMCQSQQSLEQLVEQIEEIELAYLQNPKVNYNSEVRDIIQKSYQITLDLFDQKVRQGASLLPEEIAIRDLCAAELRKAAMDNGIVRGILSGVFHAVGLARDVLDEIKGWFGLDSATDRASRVLAQAGNDLLPGYAGLIEGFFTTIDAFFSIDFTPAIIEVSQGQVEAALLYQVKDKAVDKPLAAQMLNFASLAYDGFNASLSGGYTSLAKNELPASIQVLYEERTGLLKASRGLQAWLGKKDNNLVVAFCGTDVKNIDMIYADIEQLSSPSILYLKAAGLLKLIKEQFRARRLMVTGHSLGGGLTQFSLTANLTAERQSMDGWLYNPAGLSAISMYYLKAERMKRAKQKIDVFMTAYDPVSTFGAKLGHLVTLPKSRHNGHGRNDLQECMTLYVNSQNDMLAALTPMTLCGRNYVIQDVIPYTGKVSLCSSDQSLWWPCFNEAYQTGRVRNTFIQVPALKEPLSFLQEPGILGDCCAGIYNGFNGTGQTAANRLLLAAGADACAAYGNIYPTMIFGAYGLGKRQFCTLLQQAFVESGAIYTIARSDYETMLTRLRNPYENEKEAWLQVLSYVVDLTSILRRFPSAQERLEQCFLAFSSDREDLFQSLYHERKPTHSETRSLLVQLKALAHRHLDGIMNEAVYAQILTSAQKELIDSHMDEFCDSILHKAG